MISWRRQGQIVGLPLSKAWATRSFDEIAFKLWVAIIRIVSRRIKISRLQSVDDEVLLLTPTEAFKWQVLT
jgi:hypothetical protein